MKEFSLASSYLFQGATIVDMSVTVTLDPVYQLSPGAATAPPVKRIIHIAMSLNMKTHTFLI